MAQDDTSETLNSLIAKPIGSWDAQAFISARLVLRESRARLAVQLGYSSQGIGKIETGKSPVARVVELAMRYLLIDQYRRALVEDMAP